MRLTGDDRPVGLARKGEDLLEVRWAGGHTGLHRVRDLRLACACAGCVDEWTGAGRLDPSSVPEDVRPVKIEPVGRYGIQIEWNDGHGTGIYTFDRLAELCQCPECEPRAERP